MLQTGDLLFILFTVDTNLDEIDIKLIKALRASHRATITDLARATGLARGTVQTRLVRHIDNGTIVGWGPELDPAAAGWPVSSFTTISIRQGALDLVTGGLRRIPEVLEVHVTTGAGDLLCRIAAQSNDDLHDTIQKIVALKGVERTDSQLVLSTPIRRILADLVAL